MARIQAMAEGAVDRMKTSAAAIPVIVVGGGSILIAQPIAGASEMVKPDHFEAANAVGAAIAQISGEVDRVYSLATMSRDDAVSDAKAEATAEGGRRRRGPGDGADRRRRGRPARLPARATPPASGSRRSATCRWCDVRSQGQGWEEANPGKVQRYRLARLMRQAR